MTAMPKNLKIDPLDRALALIADSADAPPRLNELADAVGLSPSHLQRAFRASATASALPSTRIVETGRT